MVLRKKAIDISVRYFPKSEQKRERYKSRHGKEKLKT